MPTHAPVPPIATTPRRLPSAGHPAPPDGGGAPGPTSTLDRLARLAARCLSAPVALVSVTDDDDALRVIGVTGALAGLGPVAVGEELTSARTPCHQVIAAAAPLVVDDARAHPLLHDHPAVRDRGVRAYVGVPLVTPGGDLLGTVCVIDAAPRAWRADDVAALADLAQAAAAELELRATSRALAAATAEYAELLDTTTELVCSADPDGRVTYANRAWCEALGYAAHEAIGLRAVDLVTPEHRGAYVDAARRLYAGERIDVFEAVLVGPTGRRVVARGHATLVLVDDPAAPGGRRCVGTRAVYRDVTAQREAEASQAQLVSARERADAARRASEARFRAAFESAALGVTILDEQGVILEVNAAFAEFVGYTPAELTGRFAPELSPPEDAAVTRGPVAELRAGVRHSVSVEKRFLHRGGEVRWAMLTLSLLPLGDGRVGLVGLTTDVTDRRRAEAARRESEARFEAALDGGRFGFAALAPVRAADGAVTDFEMLSVNAQYAALLGMPAEDVVGHRLGELLPLARTDGHLARYARVLATGEPIVDEFETRDPRITAQWLRVQVVPLRDTNGDGVADGLALMVRDVTWERRVERELRLVLGVTRALTAVSDVRAATADALAALCTAVGIEYGEVWLTSDGAASAAGSAGAPVLVHGPVWHAPDDERLARFAEASGAFRFARAQGLPGTAWDLGEPVVTESLDALGDRFSREAIAHDAGLRAGAAVPVLADGEVVAVLVFLTRTARRLEHARVELLAAVAAQIGFAVRSKLATAALRDSEARLSLIYESASDLMCLMEVRHDAAGGPPTFRCESVNEAYLAVTGLERGAVVGRTVEEVLPPAAAAFVLAKYAAAVASGDAQRYEEVVELPTGTLVLDTTLNPILDEAGRCTHLLGAARDVTGRRQAEAALRHSEARFRGVLETVRSVAVTLDLDGRVTFANDALLRLTGWSREETVGCDWFARFVPAGLETAAVFREAVVGGALPAHYENEILTRGGDRRLIAWDNTLLRDGSGVITGTASIGRDVTAQRALETRLAALSEHDELTGLLNRRGFRRMADQLLKMQRREPRRSAVLYVDLDGFKPINDTHGHAEGDRALRAVAELLQSSVRDGDLVARVGGDEFAVFATGLGERGGGELLAARLRARMDEHNERARTAGRPYAIRFSVGVADHEADDTLDTLLARADAALYARKLARRG